MFDAPYPYISLGKETPATGFPQKRWIYKFKAKYREYLVYLEQYDIGVTAIKYFDRRDKGAKMHSPVSSISQTAMPSG